MALVFGQEYFSEGPDGATKEGEVSTYTFAFLLIPSFRFRALPILVKATELSPESHFIVNEL